LTQDFFGVALIEVMWVKEVWEGENPYVRNLLERLLSEVFNQRSA